MVTVLGLILIVVAIAFGCKEVRKIEDDGTTEYSKTSEKWGFLCKLMVFAIVLAITKRFLMVTLLLTAPIFKVKN